MRFTKKTKIDRRRWVARLLPGLVIGICALAGPNAAADPTVRVKGRVRLQLDDIRHLGDRVVVVGRLLDRQLNTGVPNQVVRLQVDPPRGRPFVRRQITGPHGEFQAELPRAAGAWRIRTVFDGNTLYEPEDSDRQTLNLSRRAVRIVLELPESFDVSQASHTVTVRVTSGDRNVRLPVTLKTRAGKILGRAVTDRRGEASIGIVTRDLASKPGPVTIEATTPKNSVYNQGVTRSDSVLITPVHISASVNETRVAADDDIVVTGHVRDSLGPVVRGSVSIAVQGRTCAGGRTDEDGRYIVELPAEDQPTGTIDVVARFSPAVIWRTAARAPALEITVLVPRPVHWSRFALPAAVTAVALVLLALWRFRPRLVWPWRGRRKPASPGRQGGDQDEPAPVRSGVRLARRTFRTMIQQSWVCSGEVWDATDTRLLPGCRLEIEGPTREVLHADASGAFSSSKLAPGSYQVSVSLNEYVTERFDVQIPHRGQFEGVRVDLVQVRVRLLEIYRRVARPMLPRGELWARWTPRELVRHVGRAFGRRPANMESLTRLVERSYWSPLPSQETLVQRAVELAAEIEAPAERQQA